MANQTANPQAKKVTATRPTVAGFLAFGDRDLLPQTLMDAIDDSDTATAAMAARAEFIIGNGIDDERLADYVVNRHGETLDEVTDGIAWNITYGEAIILWVGYNGLGRITDIRSISWEQLRLAEPDERGHLTHAGIFPFLDNQFQKDKRTEFTLCPLFNPDPAVVLAQMEAVGGIRNYFGQILYVKVGKPSSDYYSIPSYFGGVKNFETEAELTESDFATVANGFGVSGFWKQLRSEAKPAQTGAGNSFEDDIDPNSTLGKIQAAQGAENTGSVVVVEASSVEELDAMGFESITGTDLANRYATLHERVMGRVARRLRTPNELVNIRKAGGIAPTGDEMKVASQIMQQTVNKWQRRIDQVLSKVLAHWHEPLPGDDFHLENLNYFTDVNQPDQVAQPN